MFYDDAGFLSAQVSVSDFILKTFKGLSLLHSDSYLITLLSLKAVKAVEGLGTI